MDSDRIEPQDAPQDDREAREDFLRQLLRRSNWKVTAELVSVARMQLGIRGQPFFGWRHVFGERALLRVLHNNSVERRKAYFASRPRLSVLSPIRIERFWLKKEKPKFSRWMERIRGTCLAEGLHPPHYRTVRRRVMDLTPVSASRKRGKRDIETYPSSVDRLF
jgi:putative transposase